jgi:hypothetical protein
LILLSLCEGGWFILDLQMKCGNHLAFNETWWRPDTENIVDGAVPWLNVIGINVQVVLRVGRGGGDAA